MEIVAYTQSVILHKQGATYMETAVLDVTTEDSHKHTVLDINIVDIVIPPNRHRHFDPLRAEILQESIEQIGLIQPIVLTPEFVLISGLHRYHGCLKAGWEIIPAVIKTFNDIDTEIAEIDENLIRFDLTLMERGDHLARRKELYEQKNPKWARSYKEPEPDQNNSGTRNFSGEESSSNGRQKTPSFIEDMVKKTGKSASQLYEETKLGQKMLEMFTPEIKDLIRPTKIADNGTQLGLLLKISDPDVRLEVAKEIHQAYLDDPKKSVDVGQILSRINKSTTYEAGFANDNGTSLEKALKKAETLLLVSIEKPEFRDTAKTWTQEGLFAVREQLFDLEKTVQKGISELTDIIEANEKLGK